MELLPSPNAPRRRGAWIVAGVLLVLLACTATTELTTFAPYRPDRVPPFWVCATATPIPTDTPMPTATPMPEPPGWPFPPPPTPTLTPTPWGWPTPTPTPWGWPTATPTPLPTATPVWQPPNWPPTPIPTYTPYPTPTPYVLSGSFYRGARVWIPVRPVERATPEAPLTGPREPEMVSLKLTAYAPLGAAPGGASGQCWDFTFELQNFSPASALDFDVAAQVFLKQIGDPTLYHADLETLTALGRAYPDPRLLPGAARSVTLPLCALGPVSDLRLGVLTSLYTSVGGSGAPGGTDTTIYLQFQELTPGCSYAPGEPGYPYPELVTPPIIPDGLPFYGGGAGGGRVSGNAPVTQPPCGGITRGFGCDDFPTGVSGAGRCPAELPYWHTGIDYSCPGGTPIYSPLEGVIDFWGNGGGYGLLSSVTGGPLRSMYAHMSAFGADPACSGLGSYCEAGTLIGYVGTTGFSTGNHLHWEVRLNGTPIDPLLYFAQGPAAGKLAAAAPPSGACSLTSAAPLRETCSLTAEAEVYPLSLSLRDPAGQPLAGPTVNLADIDGHPMSECLALTGRCEWMLPPGVYRLALSGQLADGTPVDAYGAANVAAQAHAEYHHGPLAVWHTGPRTDAGLVLVVEAGVAQPYLDATPLDAPTVLNPLAWLPEDAAPTGPGEADLAPPPLDETPVSGLPWWARLMGVLALFLGGGLVLFGARWLRKWREARQI